jgi:prophage DNA circulation protein
MIFLDSRYVDGTLFKAWHANKQEYHLTVFREYPDLIQSYFIYEWIETDRLDLLAIKFLGNSGLWWQILDMNPEIINPQTIKPGTQIRIPNA